MVPPDRDGWRLDRFLHDRIPRLSRTKIRRIIAAEICGPGDGPFKPSHRVRCGEVILIARPPPPEPEVPKSFEVLFQDEHLYVVDKPAGSRSTPQRGFIATP